MLEWSEIPLRYSTNSISSITDAQDTCAVIMWARPNDSAFADTTRKSSIDNEVWSQNFPIWNSTGGF